MELRLYSTSLLLLLLLSSSSHVLRSADGTRALRYQLKDPHPPKVGEGAATATAVSVSLIGSRPPRCDGKCAPCGRCEAVQVPVAPRVDSSRGGEAAVAATDDEPRRLGRDGMFGSVEQSYTDYKPLNWRCRCADRRALDP